MLTQMIDVDLTRGNPVLVLARQYLLASPKAFFFFFFFLRDREINFSHVPLHSLGLSLLAIQLLSNLYFNNFVSFCVLLSLTVSCHSSHLHFKHTVTIKQIKYKEKLMELLILEDINRTEYLI